MSGANPFASVKFAPAPPDIFFQDPQEAFAAAIRTGRLSEDPKAVNFAGRFMYMGTVRASLKPVRRQKAMFKSVLTRCYLPEIDEPRYAEALREEKEASS